MTSKSVLQEFGLTENEANVYLTLLRLGSATASEIAQKTNIHRINIYDILERLQERGLVSYVMVGKRKNYEATEPKRILEIEEDKIKNIKEILPELNSHRILAKSPQEATIYKDKKGIKNVLVEITKTKHPVYLFASGWGFHEMFPEYENIWYSHLKLNKVKIKALISSKFKKTKIQEPLNYRFLPSQFVFPSTTVVFGNKVFLIIWSAQPIGILIRGKEIAESYKQFFNILWKTAK